MTARHSSADRTSARRNQDFANLLFLVGFFYFGEAKVCLVLSRIFDLAFFSHAACEIYSRDAELRSKLESNEIHGPFQPAPARADPSGMKIPG